MPISRSGSASRATRASSRNDNSCEERQMFAVIFEVNPKDGQYDQYLGRGKMLRPELEQIDGFVDNVRYRSLTRDGWLLSLSGWRDEKALVRWRAQGETHRAQDRGSLE